MHIGLYPKNNCMDKHELQVVMFICLSHLGLKPQLLFLYIYILLWWFIMVSCNISHI